MKIFLRINKSILFTILKINLSKVLIANEQIYFDLKLNSRYFLRIWDILSNLPFAKIQEKINYIALVDENLHSGPENLEKSTPKNFDQIHEIK